MAPRDPSSGVPFILASSVALSIIRARRAGEHETPKDTVAEMLLITNHTTKVLAQLGMTRDEAGVIEAKWVRNQVLRRGGFGPDAQTILYSYVANCMQCMTQDLDPDAPHLLSGAAERRTWIREHTETTGHTVIQRWEQPSAL